MSKKFCIMKSFFFELLVWMIWTQTILMQYFRALVMRLPVIGNEPDLFLGVLYVIVIAMALPNFKVKAADIIVVSVLSLIFLLEMLFRGQDNQYLKDYFPNFLLTTLPLYLVGVALTRFNEEESLLYHLYILSVITIIANFIYKYLFGTPMDAIMSQYQGDMNLAYNLLPHCCLISYYARKKPNIFNIILVVISALYLLMLGTRGAALIILINIAWNLVTARNSKKTVARIIIIFGAVGAFVSSSLYNAAVLWMYKNAQKFGLSIRIFDKILTGTQLNFSGRDNLLSQLFVSIREHSLLGTGLCSDRTIVGTYAHNILVELWVEFGVIIGGIIFGALVYFLLQGFRNSNKGGERGLIIALICSSFFKLFLSGSYMDEKMLFILLGICVGAIRKRKRMTILENR